jgi:hypothetical protein
MKRAREETKVEALLQEVGEYLRINRAKMSKRINFIEALEKEQQGFQLITAYKEELKTKRTYQDCTANEQTNFDNFLTSISNLKFAFETEEDNEYDCYGGNPDHKYEAEKLSIQFDFMQRFRIKAHQHMWFNVSKERTVIVNSQNHEQDIYILVQDLNDDGADIKGDSASDEENDDEDAKHKLDFDKFKSTFAATAVPSAMQALSLVFGFIHFLSIRVHKYAYDPFSRTWKDTHGRWLIQNSYQRWWEETSEDGDPVSCLRSCELQPTK